MRRIDSLKSQKLTKELIFDIHRSITAGTLDDSSAAGRFRTREEKIVVGDEYGVVYHTPPDAGQLEERMEAMCEFANREHDSPYIHPAIRSIIIHFWLAYDHPFVDGNGRTARALFYWSMLRHEYWLFEFISISNVILKSYSQYQRAFLYSETDNEDLTYFILYHVKVISKAIDALYDYIERKTAEIGELQSDLRAMAHLNHRQKDLVVHALRHPGMSYTIDSHMRSHGVSHQTARTDLLDLAKKKLLWSQKAGRAWRFRAPPDLADRLRNPERHRPGRPGTRDKQ
jgi:Fic family protein